MKVAASARAAVPGAGVTGGTPRCVIRSPGQGPLGIRAAWASADRPAAWDRAAAATRSAAVAPGWGQAGDRVAGRAGAASAFSYRAESERAPISCVAGPFALGTMAIWGAAWHGRNWLRSNIETSTAKQGRLNRFRAAPVRPAHAARRRGSTPNRKSTSSASMAGSAMPSSPSAILASIALRSCSSRIRSSTVSAAISL